jgi:hypothetical protein
VSLSGTSDLLSSALLARIKERKSDMVACEQQLSKTIMLPEPKLGIVLERCQTVVSRAG